MGFLPHVSPLTYFRDEDSFEVKEGSDESLSNIVLKEDHGTLFVRYVSINTEFRRRGYYRRLANYLLDFCSKNRLEIFVESCNEISLKVFTEEVRHFPCYKYATDLLDEGRVDVDITFVGNIDKLDVF